MTYAICPNCGKDKMGALIACRLCFYKPATKHQVDVSLILTDHYLAPSDLRKIGRRIAAGEEHLNLNVYFLPWYTRHFWFFLRRFGATKILDKRVNSVKIEIRRDKRIISSFRQ